MNNTFDWNRFTKVVGKDCRNLWPMFGPTMLILAALPFALWLLLLVTGADAHMPADIRLWMICCLAMIAALMTPSRLYRTMNLRNEGIYYAMLPASKLEKYLSMLLYTFIVCPLLVYIGSLLLDVVLTILPIGPYKNWIWEGRMGFPLPLSFGDLPRMEFPGAENFPAGWFVVSSLTSYIASTAIFVFTATVFKKHKVLFTLLWLYLIQFVLSIAAIPVGISMSMSPDMMEWLYDSFHDWSSQQAVNLLFGSLVAFNLLLGGVLLWLTRRRLNRMPY